MNKLLIFFCSIVIVLNLNAQSQFKIFPNMTSIFNNMVIDSQVSSANKNDGLNSIYIHVSCYGRNLRKIANPMSPYNNLTAHITLNANGTVVPVKVNFPAIIATSSFEYLNTHSKWKDNINVVPGQAPTGTMIGGTHRTVRIDIPSLGQASINSMGEINIQDKTAYFRSISFTQGPPPNNLKPSSPDPQMLLIAPTVGPVSGAITTRVSADKKSVNVHASFPGAGGYCGGYYSPLMLFFDEAMPDFTGKSSFKISDEAASTFWPEANSPGYFLALDKNRNGSIDDGQELFGDQKNDHGFQSLSTLDANDDGWISSDDPEFKNLLLWNDKNGDGVSQKKELVSISRLNVIAISLKYENVARSFGDRAMYDKKSIFKFKKKGKIESGKIVDVYFQARP